MAGPGRTKPGSHEDNATGRIQDEDKADGEASHQPEHVIRPSARAVHGLRAIPSRGTGDMGNDVEQAGPARTTQNHQVLVAKIRRGHGVPSGSVPHAPPSIHAILAGGLE